MSDGELWAVERPADHVGEKVAIKTLVDITKVYALTAAEICGESSI